MSYSNIAEIWARYLEARCETAIKALVRRNYDARLARTREEAVELVLSVIPPEAEVGCGGSATVRQLGLLERMRERGNTVWAHEAEMSFDEALQVRRRAMQSQYYLSSSNAITLEGELVNTDGIGNRVAAMIFGPPTVIVVAGANKLVADLDEAFIRIQEVAAPANATRYNLDLPCVKRGSCYECESSLSICCVTTILHRKPMLADFKVILVPEELGF
jgi:hypothetical protein